MKLIKLVNGQEIRGEILETTDTGIIVKLSTGKLIVDNVDIASQKDILNCVNVPIGQFINTPKGTYMKIDARTYRLIKGPYTSPIDLDCIEDGTIVTYEEVFPPASEPVINPDAVVSIEEESPPTEESVV